MNQERFDELTQAVATKQLSRRQVLKAAGAGVLLSGPLTALSADPASAVLNPVGYVTWEQNNGVPNITKVAANYTIHTPNVGGPDSGHGSVALIVLDNFEATSDQPRATIEFGWMVAPAVYYKNTDPHLFLLTFGNEFGQR